MKFLAFLIFTLSFSGSDIAPYPIVSKGIMTHKPCNIQMIHETVELDLWMDRHSVKCTFTMKNFGDSLTLPIGFPVMHFFHYGNAEYAETDLNHVEIFVDGKKLNRSDIQIPEELRQTYADYVASQEAEHVLYKQLDSLNSAFGVLRDNQRNIIDVERGSLEEYRTKRTAFVEKRNQFPFDKRDFRKEFRTFMQNDAFPWYVWNVHFKKDETREIVVHYTIPSGVAYRDSYRYAKYLLSTGAGWKDVIGNAKVVAKLHDIPWQKLKQIEPPGFVKNRKNKTISWNFEAIEPTKAHDITIEYASPRH